MSGAVSEVSPLKQEIITDFAKWGLRNICPIEFHPLKLSITFEWKTYEGRFRAYALNFQPRLANPKKFAIVLPSRRSVMRTLLRTAHEITHVKQWHTGELIDYEGFSVWRGQPIASDDYWSLPWEVEAHGSEKTILEQWAIATGAHNEPWFRALED